MNRCHHLLCKKNAAFRSLLAAADAIGGGRRREEGSDTPGVHCAVAGRGFSGALRAPLVPQPGRGTLARAADAQPLYALAGA